MHGVLNLLKLVATHRTSERGIPPVETRLRCSPNRLATLSYHRSSLWAMWFHIL